MYRYWSSEQICSCVCVNVLFVHVIKTAHTIMSESSDSLDRPGKSYVALLLFCTSYKRSPKLTVPVILCCFLMVVL